MRTNRQRPGITLLELIVGCTALTALIIGVGMELNQAKVRRQAKDQAEYEADFVAGVEYVVTNGHDGGMMCGASAGFDDGRFLAGDSLRAAGNTPSNNKQECVRIILNRLANSNSVSTNLFEKVATRLTMATVE